MKPKIIIVVIIGLLSSVLLILQNEFYTVPEKKQLSSMQCDKKRQLSPVEYDHKKIAKKQRLRLNNLETSSMLYDPVMRNYISESDEIVIGNIKEIEYYEYEGLPWSKLTVNVNETMQGNVKTGDDISVYVMEGYQYSTPQKTELIEVLGDDIGLHTIGECIFVNLTEEDGSSIFEKGSYRRTCSCFSEYRYDKKRKKFHVYEGETEKYLEKKSIRKRIKEMERLVK